MLPQHARPLPSFRYQHPALPLQDGILQQVFGEGELAGELTLDPSALGLDQFEADDDDDDDTEVIAVDKKMRLTEKLRSSKSARVS